MLIFSFVGTPWPGYLEKVTNGNKYINKRVRRFIHHACPKHVKKKKLLGRNNKNISLKICWGSHLCKMAVAKCVRKTQKNQKLLIKIFNSTLKKCNFWTSISETSEKLYLFSFYFFHFMIILWLDSFEVCICKQYFFDITRNKLQATNI